MRRDVRNSSVIRAIISATAAMLTMTTTVGAVPMQVFAAEAEMEAGNDEKSVNDAQAQETVTITAEDAPAADAEEHPVSVEKNEKEIHVVDRGNENEEITEEAARNKVLDHTIVDTTVEVETSHVVVDKESGEAVSGITADGEVIEKIEVADENIEAEKKNVIIKEETDESGETKTVVEEIEKATDMVYGSFDETGLFVEGAGEMAAFVKDKEGNYQETTTVTSYKDVDGNEVYLTDESYDENNLKVDTVYTVKDVDGNDREVAVDTDKDSKFEGNYTAEVEAGTKAVEKTVEYKTAKVWQAVTVYRVREPFAEWQVVSKDVYDSWKYMRESNPELVEVEIDVPDEKNITVERSFIGKFNEDVSKRLGLDDKNKFAGYVEVNGEKFFVKPDGVVSDREGAPKYLATTTNSRTETVEETAYYVTDKDGNKFEVSADNIQTEKRFTLKYDGQVIAEYLSLEQKTAIVDSIESHKYIAVNQDTYAIDIPSEDGKKRIYINTDSVKVLTSHNVTFTETTTYHYVDKAKYITWNETFKANGEDYQLQFKLLQGSKIKGVNEPTVITDNGDGTVTVKFFYKVDGVRQTYEETFKLTDFGKSNIGIVEIANNPVFKSLAEVNFGKDDNVEITTSKTTDYNNVNTKQDKKVLTVQAFVRLDDIEQKENGSTHYPDAEYTEVVGKQADVALKYSKDGYDVFGSLDEEGNLLVFKGDKKNPNSEFKSQEEAIKNYLSAEDVAKLDEAAKKYADKEDVKAATKRFVDEYVDSEIAKLKKKVMDEHPEWNPEDIEWSLSDEQIEQLKADAASTARVRWYVLKYENGTASYHIDGVMMIDPIVINIDGEIVELPPAVVPTPDETPEVTPDETPEVTPDETPEVTPDETPEVTPEETPAVVPAAPAPVAAAPAVLGENRDNTETTADTNGAVLGARRSGGAVLGARRGAGAETGDTTNAAGYAALLGAAAFAGAGYVSLRRRKKED